MAFEAGDIAARPGAAASASSPAFTRAEAPGSRGAGGPTNAGTAAQPALQRERERVVMPPVFDIADPAIRLSTLVEGAERGEDIVLSRDGVPCARIVRIRPPVRTFTAVVERCPGTGVYVGYIPGLADVREQGDTLDELNANLVETVALILEEGEPAFETEFAGILTIRV